MTLPVWKGSELANFAVFLRYGRDYPKLASHPEKQSLANYDSVTGVQWGRSVFGENGAGWEDTYFTRREDAISFAKDKEWEYRNRPPDPEFLMVEAEVYGGIGKYLELLVMNRYGMAIWDYPKTIQRPISALLISRYRWQYLLQPENMRLWQQVRRG